MRNWPPNCYGSGGRVVPVIVGGNRGERVESVGGRRPGAGERAAGGDDGGAEMPAVGAELDAADGAVVVRRRSGDGEVGGARDHEPIGRVGDLHIRWSRDADSHQALNGAGVIVGDGVAQYLQSQRGALQSLVCADSLGGDDSAERFGGSVAS